MYPAPHSVRLVPTRLSAVTFFRRPCATPFARRRVSGDISVASRTMYCGTLRSLYEIHGRCRPNLLRHCKVCRSIAPFPVVEVEQLLRRGTGPPLGLCLRLQLSVAQAIGYQGHQLNWAALENDFKPTRLQRPSTPSSNLISSLLVLSRPFGV